MAQVPSAAWSTLSEGMQILSLHAAAAACVFVAQKMSQQAHPFGISNSACGVKILRCTGAQRLESACSELDQHMKGVKARIITRTYLVLSWYSSMTRRMSARQASSSSHTLSGGRPPLLLPKLMAPLVGWNLMPISLHWTDHM